MADGANDGTVRARFAGGENWTLIDDEDGATNDGVWMDASDFWSGSVDVAISGTATVQIRGDDSVTRPANTAHGRQVGDDITSSGSYSLVYAPRWVKARVSAYTSGTVDVNATMRRST